MADSLNRDLTKALSALAGGAPLRDGATRLLGALGYRSRRTADAGSVAEFLERLDSAKPDRPLTDRQRALFEPWRAVEIVFQLTDAEIGGQPGLFDAIGGFERGRIESFLFLAVDLKEDAYTRTHLAETVRAVNARYAMPVVVLFRHGPSLTLAAVHRRTHGRDTERDVLEKVTLVKDVRASAPHRAHVDVLADLALPAMIRSGVRDFDGLHAAWEKVLDIETLNRRFYRELFDWFQRATAACRFPDDGAGDGSTERHVIRLVTRLLFIWFLKEKKLVPDGLFDEGFARQALRKHAPDRTDYYRAVLQNLFFATLNTEIDKRAFSTQKNRTHRDFTKYRYRDKLTDPDGFTDLLRSVPFVNGGLFDCLDDFASVSAGGRRIDAFTDNKTHGKDLDVPARLFLDPDEGLFPLFRRYKFTVEENTPLDREVALDPELLGRVFENLLAAYNPETRETARKATGSYYTPRAVVDYMVGEALAEVLAAKVGPADDADWRRERLGYLLDWEDACDDAATLFQPDEAESVVRAIAGLKVLDPAVGSGAFPMGVLQTLTLALRRLDPDNALWEAFQKERAKARAGAAFDTGDRSAREVELREINDTFEKYRQSDFGRKLYLIQNGVYGVDIQPIACQIAKLRFFISLVIEQEPDPGAPNLGVKPLPNLETRFVAADTLVGIGTEPQGVLRSDAVRALEDRLRRVRERHFNARARADKLALAREDRELRAVLADELERLGFAHDSARAVAEWDPYDQNARASWFDPEWMFGVAGGFDAVIGNPPYVESRNNLLSEQAKQAYGNQVRVDWDDNLPRGSDLLIYFLARGAKLLHESGVSCGCFITQNAWLSTDYGLAFQSFTKNRFSFNRIVDTSAKFFSDPNGPNINAIISLFSRAKKSHVEYVIADADMGLGGRRTIQTRQGIKWGHLFSMPEFFESILISISGRQCPDGLSGIRFGQGINIPKSKLNRPGATMGVIVNDPQFVARKSDAKLNPSDIPEARRNRFPALILPRGIGNRHYCTFNIAKAFSFSAVDLYLPDDLWGSNLHYCLWAYLNSSFVWLFREITGRKNLGGGMLKAEATDMKALPIAFDFDFGNEARKVFDSLGSRAPLPIPHELDKEDHLFIDNMVARFFGYPDCTMERIRHVLLKQVEMRVSRARASR